MFASKDVLAIGLAEVSNKLWIVQVLELCIGCHPFGHNQVLI